LLFIGVEQPVSPCPVWTAKGNGAANRRGWREQLRDSRRNDISNCGAIWATSFYTPANPLKKQEESRTSAATLFWNPQAISGFFQLT
jgi:hypothetical protein